MGEVVALFPGENEARDAFEKWSAMVREKASNPGKERDARFMAELERSNREWRRLFVQLERAHDA